MRQDRRGCATSDANGAKDPANERYDVLRRHARSNQQDEVGRGPVEARPRHCGRADGCPDRVLVRGEPDADLEGL